MSNVPLALLLQTVTEKHKLNVPETMTEVLDVSDEEGESCCTEPILSNAFYYEFYFRAIHECI